MPYTQDPALLQGFYSALKSGSLLSRKETQIVTQMRQTVFQVAEHKMQEYNSALARINELAAELNKLESEHRLALDSHRSCTKLLRNRDFRMLPTEVVSQIFQYAIPNFPRLDPNEAPLLLCRVCSVWRNIAQGLPSLWTNIWLPDTVGHSRRRPITSADAALLHKTWIANCGKLPMSLSLSIDTSADIEWLAAILPTIKQPIRCLSIHSPQSTRSYTCLEFMRTTFIPTASTIDALTLSHPLSGSTAISFLESFPNLRRLSLEPCPHTPLSAQWALWSTLTTLEITSHLSRIDANLWRAIFSKCLKLQSGTFTLYSTVSLEHFRQISTLPDLRVLKLDVMGEGFLLWLLQGFSFPNLRSLNVKGTWPYLSWRHEDPSAIAPIDPLIASLSTLDSLVLHNVSISESYLRMILLLNRSLRHLDLQLPYDTTNTITDLAESIYANYQNHPRARDIDKLFLPPGIERTIRLGMDIHQVPSMILTARRIIILSQAADENHGNQRGYPSLRIIISIYFPTRDRNRFMEQIRGLECAVQEEMDRSNRSNWRRYIQIKFGGFIRMNPDPTPQ